MRNVAASLGSGLRIAWCRPRLNLVLMQLSSSQRLTVVMMALHFPTDWNLQASATGERSGAESSDTRFGVAGGIGWPPSPD